MDLRLSVPFPEGYGATVHLFWPGKGFQLLGMSVSRQLLIFAISLLRCDLTLVRAATGFLMRNLRQFSDSEATLLHNIRPLKLPSPIARPKSQGQTSQPCWASPSSHYRRS